jgi:hypothetical protein
LLALHIGDRILEINGTPVGGRPLGDIEKVLTRPDAVLQVTPRFMTILRPNQFAL